MNDAVRYREVIILLALIPFTGMVIYTVIAAFYIFSDRARSAAEMKRIVPKRVVVFGCICIGAFIGILLIGVIGELLIWGTL
jgi:hypothetical protein